jgi:hypothetical protein
MAVLVKEALNELDKKEKDIIKDIFKKIEDEIQNDNTLKSILSLNKIDDLNKLFMFLDNPSLKQEIEKTLGKLNITMHNIKIDVLNSNDDLNKKIENMREKKAADDVLYVSMSAFRNTGEKISGAIIAAQAGLFGDKEKNKEKEKTVSRNRDKEDIQVIEVTDERKVKKNRLSDMIRESVEREEEFLRKKKLEDDSFERKEKNPEMGMPRRGNPGVNGPGL